MLCVLVYLQQKKGKEEKEEKKDEHPLSVLIP